MREICRLLGALLTATKDQDEHMLPPLRRMVPRQCAHHPALKRLPRAAVALLARLAARPLLMLGGESVIATAHLARSMRGFLASARRMNAPVGTRRQALCVDSVLRVDLG